ncbi:MAG: hypothetical protein B7Z57_02305 [Acidiphilium sp. 37-60-79]|nr:MAG: hypothetical protein B7Z57_02305 [Acidiphilium sp. 37-60-79]
MVLATGPLGDGSAAGVIPVVCVGGSAGGLDAYIRLLETMPSDLGVAIVIVNPKFGSLKLANRGKSDGNWCNGNDKWGNFGSPRTGGPM